MSLRWWWWWRCWWELCRHEKILVYLQFGWWQLLFIVYMLDCGVIIYGGDRVLSMGEIHRQMDDLETEPSAVGLPHLLFFNPEKKKK